MASKLTDITASFHTFETDQVLTAGQLNEVLNYFDDQDRLTRISLNGVGIVCGFKIDNTTNPQQIIIRQGCGVTTDGDLVHLQLPGSEAPLKKISLQNVVFTHFRPFVDSNAHYPKFIRNNSQITLWEIIPGQENKEDTLPSLPGYKDMVALLYVESYEDKESLCEGLSCDNQGVHQVANVRVLLASQSDATHILQNDALFMKHDLMPTYLQLPELDIKRVLIPEGTEEPKTLADTYNIGLESGLINSLSAGLGTMGAKVGAYFPDNPFASIAKGITDKLATNKPVQLFYQYRHDLLRDVVDTYNELREAFIRISTECCPALDAFPKHLMLGKVNPTENDELSSRFRHRFLKSPAAADDSQEFARFSSLLKRLDEQLKAYPTVPEDPKEMARPVIKVTPSRYRTPLGHKAIPFYYNLSLPLLKAWDNEKTLFGRQARNTAYDTTLLALSDPLIYSLEQFNFLRIEGHQGTDYREAIKTIDALKKKYRLSFDVKAIGIYEDPNHVIDPEEYECEFEDLSVLLKAWVKEQECNLASVTSLISAFSLKDPGRNIKESTYIPPRGFTPIEVINNLNLSSASPEETLGLLTEANTGEYKKLNYSLAALTPPLDRQNELKEVMDMNSRYYQSNNTVLENLTVVEGTIGHSVLTGIRSNINGSAQDIINDAGIHAYDVAHDVADYKWKPDAYKALVDNSIEILSYAHVLANSIPLSVADITDEVIRNYNLNINRMCLVLKRIQVTHKNSPNLSQTNQAILGLLINQLSSICCSSKQLQTLLEEIDQRKDAIIGRLTLAEFASEHPGLEHLGGVEPGGTFVIVYLKNGALDAGTVVADFSLPYMCCSDCAPINYIIPKANVRLSIAKNIFCLGNDISPVIFQVDPADGDITASMLYDGMHIEGNELHIDPDNFPDEGLNKIITFKVNDLPTDCQLKIVRPLTADFIVPESPATNTLVDFVPVGNFPVGTKFHWDFGDGSTSNLEKPSYNYKLPVNSTNTVTVKLTVIPPGGACPTSATNDITFEEITVELDKYDFCISDTSTHNFIISPAGAAPEITVQGVTPDNKGFIPANAYEGEQSVLVNGVAAFTVTVNPRPALSKANATIDSNILYLNGSVDFEDQTAWDFYDDKNNKVHGAIINQVETSVSLAEFYNISPGAQFRAVLTASNKCGTRTVEFKLTYPAGRETCSLDATNTVRRLKEELESAIGSKPVTSVVFVEVINLFNAVRTFFQAVGESPALYLSGNRNNEVTQKIPSFLKANKDIYDKIAPGDYGYEHLPLVYQLTANLFYTIFQCQDEKAWEVARPTIDMIMGHIDPKDERSFPSMGIYIDPNEVLQRSLETIKTFRVEGTVSYDSIEYTITLLKNGHGGKRLAFEKDPVQPAPTEAATLSAKTVAPKTTTTAKTTTAKTTTPKKPARPKRTKK